MDSMIGIIKKAAPDCVAYGSFSNTSPDSNSHDYMYLHPKRVVITDPSEFTFFEDKFFYMTFETTKDMKVSIHVKNDDTPVKTIKKPEFFLPISKETLG